VKSQSELFRQSFGVDNKRLHSCFEISYRGISILIFHFLDTILESHYALLSFFIQIFLIFSDWNSITEIETSIETNYMKSLVICGTKWMKNPGIFQSYIFINCFIFPTTVLVICPTLFSSLLRFKFPNTTVLNSQTLFLYIPTLDCFIFPTTILFYIPHHCSVLYSPLL
jgi:hypothetical protein